MRTETVSVPASQLSSLRCGGVIEKAFAPRSVRELRQFYEDCDGDFRILGGLTNTLVLSGGISEPTVITENLRGMSVEGDVVKVSGGEKLSRVAKILSCYGLSGLEKLVGIPGTVGGAIMGNAGCFGQEISEIVDALEIFRLDTGETEILGREEIAFSYRYSNLREDRDLILKARLRLFPTNAATIANRMEDCANRRRLTQPSLPSLGSVFKKIGDKSAGWYVEKVGLKGYRYGGMEFSDVHANFIVNRGGVPEDYLYLVGLAEKKIYETFGVKPEREVKIIGEQGDL